MIWKRHFVTALVLIGGSYSAGAAPVTVEVLEARKIWDEAPHNAFTDLARWNDAFYCAFREGRGHVSTDGKIRVLKSKDADHWESVALISLSGFDLRDAHLSVTPDSKVFAPRLMLVGGAAPRKQDGQSAPTGTFVSFGTFWKGGIHWSEPQIAVEPGRWLWQVSWYKDRAYGVSYTAGSGDTYLDLLVSTDGIHYQTHVSRLFEQGRPSEVTLRFDTDGTCYALVRRDRSGSEPSSAMLGESKPDYTQWQWKDLGAEFNGFGGPNFIRISGGHWIAAGRMHGGGSHTALCYLDVKKGVMTKLAKLPSGGDTSYPGLVWYNGVLYVSYYSSHEGKTSIYLAKVKITPKSARETGSTSPAKAFLDAREILKTWKDNYAHFDSMKVSYTHRVLEAVPPADDPKQYDSLVRVMHVERVEQGQRFHLRYSCDEEGFSKPDSIIEGSFDGEITREYFAVQKSGMIIAGLIGRNTELMNRLKAYMFLDKPRLVRRNPPGSFEIYWIEDPNSKPTLSRVLSSAIASSSVSVLPNLEPVAGQMCHVLEISNRGRLGEKIWLANEKRMLPLKRQQYINDKPVVDFTVEQIGSVVTDEGEVWYPKRAYQTTDLRRAGKLKYELIAHEFVPNVQVDKSTFRFDFPKGTRILDRVRGISGVDLPEEPPSLVGKALPSLENLSLGFDLAQIKDRMILVCFWGMEQRPSRNCIMQLAKRAEQLKNKDVAVVAIHASDVDRSTLREWVKQNKIPFPIGTLRGDAKQTCFNWGAQSLPWLILTDGEHIIRAEGFGLDKLDAKIEQAGDGK